MPTKQAPLKPNLNNAKILNMIRNSSSLDYQQRIPVTTQATVADTMRRLLNYRQHYNEFIDGLVNRIGSVIIRDMSWSNPMAEFKVGLLDGGFGDTIEEVQVGLIDAKIYDSDRETTSDDLLRTERPDVQTNFHTVNRQSRYDLTINESLLKRAFLDDTGLSQFVTGLMASPNTSDELDEFKLMLNLFSEYNHNGGFYNVQIPDVVALNSTEADAKAALRRIRQMSGDLGFVSTKYNAAHMPTFAKPSELLLFASPAFQAAIDVEALAAAFNIERAEVMGRIVTIPSDGFAIPGVQALMTTKDFFIVADTLLQNTSFYDPAGLATKYFLHHWQIISASRFVPAVTFGTGSDSGAAIMVRSYVVTMHDFQVLVTDSEGIDVTTHRLQAGNTYALTPQASSVTIGADESDISAVPIVYTINGVHMPRTYVTPQGVLHIAPDESATQIDITATAQDFNGATVQHTTVSLSVGNPIEEWPVKNRNTSS